MIFEKIQNFIEKDFSSLCSSFAKAITPITSLSRQPTIGAYRRSENGYPVPGSARKSMKGVTATQNSPDRDILPGLEGIRALSRDMFMNAPLATAILRRDKVLTIGPGLQVQPVLDRDFLQLSQEEAEQIARTVEREFDLWANSCSSDYTEMYSFGVNQALGYLNFLVSGDFFLLPVSRPPREKDFPYDFCVKLIDADLVRDPSNSAKYENQDIAGGVAYDENGRVLGYHVWNSYPDNSYIGSLYGKRNKIGKSIFVPLYDETGRKQIHHILDPERINQRRGVPRLANVAEHMKQLTRLSEAALMDHLISSYFTVFVRDQSGYGSLLGDPLTPEETVTGGGRYGPGTDQAETRNIEDSNDVELGVGSVVYLDDGKDITIADPKKTDKDFKGFFESLATVASAGGNQPIEQALMHYTTSYTAARAAANDVWRHRLTDRAIIEGGMCQVCYEEVFTEGVLKSRIRAPRFFDDYTYQKAWTKSLWVGFGQGSLDPLRETKAAVLKLQNNLTTHEEEYQKDKGGRWSAAMNKKALEHKRLEELELNEEKTIVDMSDTGDV